MAPNTHHGLFLICHFVHTYMHNSKTKGHIRTFYLPNNCSTLEISTFCVRAACEMRLASYESKHALQPLRYDILCVLTLITRKVQLVYGCSTYQTTALLLVMSIFCVKAGCKIWLVSYGSKHASQSLSDKPLAHTYTHNLKTTGDTWTFSTLNNCPTIKDITSVV